MFSFIYFLIVGIAASNALEQETKTLTNITGLTLKGSDESVGANGINVTLHIILYSFSIFFQIPSSIKFEGLPQIIILVQRISGIMTPLVILGYAILKEFEKNNRNMILYTFLNRGWNILRVRDSYSGSYKTLELINTDFSIKQIIIEDQKNIKEELDYFMIDWSTINDNMLPYFLRVIYELLLTKKSELWSESVKLFSDRDIKDVEYCKKYAELLHKISNEFRNLEEINTHNDILTIIDRLNRILNDDSFVNINITNEDNSHA